MPVGARLPSRCEWSAQLHPACHACLPAASCCRRPPPVPAVLGLGATGAAEAASPAPKNGSTASMEGYNMEGTKKQVGWVGGWAVQCWDGLGWAARSQCALFVKRCAALNRAARNGCRRRVCTKAPRACAHAHLGCPPACLPLTPPSAPCLPPVDAPPCLSCRASAPSAGSSCWPSSRPTPPRLRPSKRPPEVRQQQRAPVVARGAPAQPRARLPAPRRPSLSLPPFLPLLLPAAAPSCNTQALYTPERKIFYPCAHCKPV